MTHILDRDRLTRHIEDRMSYARRNGCTLEGGTLFGLARQAATAYAQESVDERWERDEGGVPPSTFRISDERREYAGEIRDAYDAALPVCVNDLARRMHAEHDALAQVADTLAAGAEG